MDDYRARFKSWKCPIRGELTIEAHEDAALKDFWTSRGFQTIPQTTEDYSRMALEEARRLERSTRIFGEPNGPLSENWPLHGSA